MLSSITILGSTDSFLMYISKNCVIRELFDARICPSLIMSQFTPNVLLLYNGAYLLYNTIHRKNHYAALKKHYIEQNNRTIRRVPFQSLTLRQNICYPKKLLLEPKIVFTGIG